MPNSEMLNASCASASGRSRAALTAGITGRNRWTVSGPISAIDARDNRNKRVGTGAIAFFSLRYQGHLSVDRIALIGGLSLPIADGAPVRAPHAQYAFCARLGRVIHLELDRMRGVLEADHLLHLQVNVAVDEVVFEHVIGFEEGAVLVEISECLAQ